MIKKITLSGIGLLFLLSPLSVSAQTIIATKYSGYGNQAVVPGTVDARIGSFILSSGPTEGVNVRDIIIDLSSEEAAKLTNLRLVDSATGAAIGTAKPTPSISNSFIANIKMPASSTKRINVIANIKIGVSSSSVIATVDAATGGTGLSSGSATTIGDDLDLQTITISPGTLTITRGAGTPVNSNVIAGTSMIHVGKFDFTGINSSYTVQELKVKVPSGAATSVSSVTLKYKNSTGVEQTVSQALSLPSSAQTHATATFSGLTMYVPLNSSADVDVYVDTSTIVSGATSGAAISVILDRNEGFKAVDSAGGSDTSLATIDVRSNATAGYGTKYVKKSLPTLTRLTTGYTPNIVAPGVGFYRFMIVADDAGDIEWRRLTFKVTATGVTASQWTLYDVTASMMRPVNSRPVNVGVNGFLTICPGTSCTIGEAEEIGAGSSKIYELRPGVVTDWGQAVDSIVIYFAEDKRPVPNAAALVQRGRMIWSDRSALSHSTTTSDWTNGYLVKDTDNDTRQCVFVTETTCTPGTVASVDREDVIANIAASLVSFESILKEWLSVLLSH